VSGSDRRRRRWFHLGDEALRRTVGTTGVYRCPVCLADFAIADLERGALTDGHVPPASLGGPPLVLTCQPCNDTAELDVHAVRREVVERILERPAVEDRWEQPAASRLWLRSAYLAAFAALGYRYILDRPELDALRSELRSRETGLVAKTILRRHPVAPDHASMLLVRDPEPLRGALMVSLDRAFGLLPGLGSEPEFFERAHDALAASGIATEAVAAPINWSGTEISWPRRPMFDLDDR
jgi:hypothetical protein